MRLFLSALIGYMFLCKVAYPQTNWVQTEGPTGGVVNVIDTTSAGAILAGTDGSGVFRSVDEAASWSRSNTTINNLRVLSFDVLPGGTILAGTYQQGILESTDDGQSWQSFGLPGVTVQSIVAKTASIIFATALSFSGAGVERTTDGGATWAFANTGLPTFIFPTDIELHPNGDLFFAPGANTGVYRSTNNGDSWAEVNTGLDVSVLDMAIASNGDLIAATQGGIYRSTDLGAQWNVSNNGLPGGAQCTRLHVSRNGSIYTALSGDGLVYASTDGAQTWFAFSDGLPQRQVRALGSGNTVLLAGTFGLGTYGITITAQSPNAGWAPYVTGLRAVEISDLSLVPRMGGLPTIIASSFRGSNVQATTNGSTWSILGDTPPTMDIKKLVADEMLEVYYAVGAEYGASTGGVIVLTTNQQWTRKTNGLSGNNNFLDADVNPNTHKVNIISPSEIYGTTDQAENWFVDGNGLPPNRIMLAVEYNRSEQKWYTSIGTNGGSDGEIHTRTSDNADWSISYSISGTFLTKIALNSAVQDELAGIANNGIVYRCDAGGCAPLTNGFPAGGYASTIEYSPNGLIHVGILDVGVLKYNSNGWEAVGNNLPRYDYRGIKFAQTQNLSEALVDTSIFVGVYGRGVYRLGPIITNVESVGGELPDRLKLNQNYPNPFNPTTEIGFGLPAGKAGIKDYGLVSLQVYDLLGREVATLVNEVKAPGEYIVKWDARGFASGVYFYQLRANEQVLSRKLILLR